MALGVFGLVSKYRSYRRSLSKPTVALEAIPEKENRMKPLDLIKEFLEEGNRTEEHLEGVVPIENKEGNTFQYGQMDKGGVGVQSGVFWGTTTAQAQSIQSLGAQIANFQNQTLGRIINQTLGGIIV
jgi:hypothetical protein